MPWPTGGDTTVRIERKQSGAAVQRAAETLVSGWSRHALFLHLQRYLQKGMVTTSPAQRYYLLVGWLRRQIEQRRRKDCKGRSGLLDFERWKLVVWNRLLKHNPSRAFLYERSYHIVRPNVFTDKIHSYRLQPL